MRLRLLRALVAIAWMAAMSSPAVAAAATTGNGGIAGRVIDASSRHAIAGVEVSISGPDSLLLRTDISGYWRADNIRSGRYLVRTRIMGYAATTHTFEIGESQFIERTITLDATPLSLEQMVVTAARREQRLKDAVATVELIGRSDIERTGATDVAAVLLDQTGIQLQGGLPAGTGVMLQGIGSERVLVLLDGQPVAGRINGIFDISRFPVGMIERVEVVRGPQSTLYGTEAMGGVVNIISRNAPTTDGTFYAMGMRGTLGTQRRTDGSASFTLSNASLGSAIDVSRRQMEMTPGMSETGGALTARSDVSARLRWKAGRNSAIEGSMLGLDERQRWLSASLYNFGDNRQWSGRLHAVLGTDIASRNRVSATISGSWYDHLQRYSTESRPIVGDPGSRQTQRVLQLDALYNGHLSDALMVDAGTQVRQDAAETERVEGGLRTITTIEPYVQAEAALTPELSVVPGLRLTTSSEWGAHLTPHIAGRYRIGEHLTLRASLGSGFRAPDFKERYISFVNSSAGYAVRGNPALRPESSRNVMGGAEWASSRSYLRIQAFYNNLTGFIEARPISLPNEPEVWEYGNIDNGVTQGLELEHGLSLAGFRADAGISTLSTRDDATGRALLGRPSLSARIAFSPPVLFDLRIGITGIYTGRTPMERDDTTGLITSWRDAYPRVDLRIARRIGSIAGSPELVVGVNNVYDMQPLQWAGFNRRHIYTSFSWDLSRTIQH